MVTECVALWGDPLNSPNGWKGISPVLSLHMSQLVTKCRPVFRVAGNSLNNCLQGDDEKKEGEEKEDEEEEESEEEESEEESEEEEGEEGVKVAYCYKISEF